MSKSRPRPRTRQRPGAMAGGPAAEVRQALANLVEETKTAQARTDSSIKDVGSTVERLAGELQETDKRAAEALTAAAEALTAANDNHVGPRLDDLHAEMRAAVGRLDSLEAAPQLVQPANDNGDSDFATAFNQADNLRAWIDAGCPRDQRPHFRVPSLLEPRVRTAPVLDSTELGPLVLDAYRPGVVSLLEDPVGLIDVINRVPAITTDTYKFLRWTSMSQTGYVHTTLAADIDGDPTPVNTCTFESVIGFMEGTYVRFHTSGGVHRKKIVSIDTGTKVVTFATDDLDFDASTGDAVTSEQFLFTAEAAEKPAGFLEVEEKSQDMKTLATYLEVTKQRLRNTPQLASWVESTLRERIRQVVEYHLIYGDGTATGELAGFMSDADLQTDLWSAMDTGDTKADLLVAAAMNIPSPSLITAVLNKVDWNNIVKMKASDGHYVHTSYGPVRVVDSPAMRMVGSVRVVLSKAMLQGEALVADLRAASELVPHANMTSMEWGYYNTQFIKNLITALYEEGMTHAILDPTAFRKASWDSAPT